jgi:hypothetical protein
MNCDRPDMLNVSPSMTAMVFAARVHEMAASGVPLVGAVACWRAVLLEALVDLPDTFRDEAMASFDAMTAAIGIELAA